MGVADIARAIHEGRPHRASGELAYHVLEVLLALSGQSGQSGERQAVAIARARTLGTNGTTSRCWIANTKSAICSRPRV